MGHVQFDRGPVGQATVVGRVDLENVRLELGVGRACRPAIAELPVAGSGGLAFGLAG